MFYIVFLHGYCPVGSIVTNGSWNLESARKFCIDHYFAGFIKIMSKLAFTLAVAEHIIGNMLFRFVCGKCRDFRILTLPYFFSQRSSYSSVTFAADSFLKNIT